ncbi:MAG: insulinase family protein [Cyclobacteriaceae bacterium]
MFRTKILSAIVILAITFGCSEPAQEEKTLSVPFEKYELANGLDVILHEDKSDPIVAVSIIVHVGSNREKPGRTGFAHFFEHMLFQKSENVPQGGFFKNINEYGGTFNGGTSNDFTIYFETVPKDALEKVLWMESDRMGFFINAIGVKELEGEKPVVKNEKRQRVDNQPYGHTDYVIRKALYPEGHPYNWTVIGELEDLQNATIEDVKEFYDKWYGPNNATLVIAGDYKKEEVKAMVEKYFGEIPARGDNTPLGPMPVTLEETKVLYHEDNFASLPEIRMTFPTVESFHPDQWPLDALQEILSDGKRAPLYKNLVEKAELAPESGVSASHSNSELAGTFTIRVRANKGVDLDTVRTVIESALEQFEAEGFSQKDLDRIKARQETQFYNGISSVFNKSFQLAFYNEYAGDPGFITKDIENIKAVTKEDVMRVYRKYIKGQNMIVTNFVPSGETGLALEGAAVANVKEEDITPYQPSESLEQEADLAIAKTPSSFDRSVEPGFGEEPLVVPPVIWTDKTGNGMSVYGIESKELPLVQFSIRIMGGLYLDDPNKIGAANLITDMMMEGTATKTPEELEDAIGQLGSSINMNTTPEYIAITGNCLARNYQATMDLVTEIVLEPRWDAEEFERKKQSTINAIQQRESNPNAIATLVLNKLLYGDDHILSHPTQGYIETVEAMTLEDVKAYYDRSFSPTVTNFHVAGDVSQVEVNKALEGLASRWEAKEVVIPTFDEPAIPENPMVYFVDIPKAKQSTMRIARLTAPGNDPLYNTLNISNDRLGGGGSGQLFQVLREEKGFTYGAYSFVNRKAFDPGIFMAYSSVRSNVTKESLDAFKAVIGGYGVTYNAEELEKTQVSMIKENTRAYETLGDLLGILQNISTYDLPLDYLAVEQQAVQDMTVDKVKAAVEEYMDLNNMIYLIIGDKETQFDRLKVEGVGNPILLDKYGNEVNM